MKEKNLAAQELGRLGKGKTSERKKASSRNNGKLGRQSPKKIMERVKEKGLTIVIERATSWPSSRRFCEYMNKDPRKMWGYSVLGNGCWHEQTVAFSTLRELEESLNMKED